jgi:opacity protein-like surface antigen
VKQILFFLFLISMALTTATANEKKWQIAVLAGITNVAETGSEADYILGENDFPVTPAHNSMGIGLTLDYALSERVVLQIAGQSFFTSHVTLEDPSDKDTVEIEAAKHFSITANAVCRFAGKTIKPYLLAGIGVDTLSAEDKTYTSAAGYEILFLAPEKKTDLLFNLGAGLQFHFSQTLGVLVGTRYVIIFCEPHLVKSLNLSAGVFIKL